MTPAFSSEDVTTAVCFASGMSASAGTLLRNSPTPHPELHGLARLRSRSGWWRYGGLGFMQNVSHVRHGRWMRLSTHRASADAAVMTQMRTSVSVVAVSDGAAAKPVSRATLENHVGSRRCGRFGRAEVIARARSDSGGPASGSPCSQRFRRRRKGGRMRHGTSTVWRRGCAGPLRRALGADGQAPGQACPSDGCRRPSESASVRSVSEWRGSVSAVVGGSHAWMTRSFLPAR